MNYTKEGLLDLTKSAEERLNLAKDDILFYTKKLKELENLD